MLKIRIVIFLLLALAFPLKTVQAALEGLEDGKVYTQQELEALARQQLGSGYSEYQAGMASIEELKSQISAEKKKYSEMQNKLNERVRAGIITDEEYNKQSKELKKGNEDLIKKLDKEVKKQEKKVADFKKEYEKSQKDIQKQLDKQKKEAAKEAKAQEKLENKASKQNDKLQAALKECEAMVASPEKREACAEKARKKYGLSDEQQAALDKKTAREEAEKEEARKKAEKEKSDAYLNQIMSVEEDEEPDPLFSSGGNAEGSESKSGLGGICGDAGNVFSQIACKATQLLIDLRVIAYVISGFGMIAFAYAAIFNKISWKHFSQIGIGLFILSVMGPLVEYISGDDRLRVNLEYGNYLGGRYKGIEGASDDIDCGHGVNANNCLPDVEVTAPKKKWSIKDLKGSIQAGIDVARGAYKTYQGAKATVQTVKQNASAIKNAIKNSGGGLDGVLSAATQVAGATNNIMFAGKTGMNALAMGVTDMANAAQDMTATNAERKKNQNIRLNGENGKTTNKVAAWLSAEGAGGKMVNDASRVANTVSKGASSVGVAANAGYEGKKMGGGGTLGAILGGAMAAGTAVGEGVGLYTDEKMAAAMRKEEKAQQAEAKQAAAKKEAQQASQQAASQKAAEKAEIMKQSQAILDNFAKQQGSAAGGNKTAVSAGNTSASASQTAVSAPKTQAVSTQAKNAGPAAESVRTTQPVRPASQVIAENNKSGANANVGTSSTSEKQGGAAPVATGSVAPKLTNKDGSSSSLNSDGSITVADKNGSTFTHAADSDYAKSIVAYMRDNPGAAEKIFMDTEKNGGEAYNGLNEWKKAQGL